MMAVWNILQTKFKWATWEETNFNWVMRETPTAFAEIRLPPTRLEVQQKVRRKDTTRFDLTLEESLGIVN